MQKYFSSSQILIFGIILNQVLLASDNFDSFHDAL